MAREISQHSTVYFHHDGNQFPPRNSRGNSPRKRRKRRVSTRLEAEALFSHDNRIVSYRIEKTHEIYGRGEGEGGGGATIERGLRGLRFPSHRRFLDPSRRSSVSDIVEHLGRKWRRLRPSSKFRLNSLANVPGNEAETSSGYKEGASGKETCREKKGRGRGGGGLKQASMNGTKGAQGAEQRWCCITRERKEIPVVGRIVSARFFSNSLCSERRATGSENVATSTTPRC